MFCFDTWGVLLSGVLDGLRTDPPQATESLIFLLCKGSTLIFDSDCGLFRSEILSNIRGNFHICPLVSCRLVADIRIPLCSTPQLAAIYIGFLSSSLPSLPILPCVSRSNPHTVTGSYPLSLTIMARSSQTPTDRECLTTLPQRHTPDNLHSRLAYAAQQLPPSQWGDRTTPIH